MTTSLENNLVAAIRGGSETPAMGGRRAPRAVQYWRMWTDDPDNKRHNWINVGPSLNPSTAVEYTEFMEKKAAQPLPEYGKYDGVKNLAQGIDRSEPYGSTTRYNPLLRQGGLKEFPRSQIIALGWHRKPEFLEELIKLDETFADVEQFVCDIDGKVFNSQRELQTYMRAMYPESANSAVLGAEMSKAITQMPGAGGGIDAEQMMQILTALSETQAKAIGAALAEALKPEKEGK